MRRFRRFETSLGSHFQKTSSFTLSSIDRVDDCLSGIVACDAIYGEINILISGQMPPFASFVVSSLLKATHALPKRHCLEPGTAEPSNSVHHPLPSQDPGSSQAFSQTPKTPYSTEASMHEYQKLGTVSLELCSALVIKSIPWILLPAASRPALTLPARMGGAYLDS